MNPDSHLDREYTPIESLVPEIVTTAEIARLRAIAQAADVLSRRMVEISDMVTEEWKWRSSILFGEELIALNRALDEVKGKGK